MYQLYQGDCLEIMKNIKSESVDMILCDLPYGTTKNKWDNVIDFDKLWEQYNRIIKPNGAIVLFAQGMFTSNLMQSNKKIWRYNLILEKDNITGHLNAKRQPLRKHEDICVFYKKQPTYNPQMSEGTPYQYSHYKYNTNSSNYGNQNGCGQIKNEGKRYPVSVIKINKVHPKKQKVLHPCQKSLDILEWLIKTYTNENELVLDNCMGSGSTGVACMNTNRRFIGIELNEEYFNIAKNRIESVEN